MTANEIINEALRCIIEPIAKEHIEEVKCQDKARKDVSLQRERLAEISMCGDGVN